MLGQRRRLLVTVVLIAVLCTVVGWVAGSRIQSPASVARESETAPQDITAPVERRVLSSTVVVRGDATFSAQADLVIDPDIGQQGLTGGRVVTGRVPAVGRTLEAGSVALEVSGRPVFVLRGTLPMYRPLGRGSRGADVKQFEAALAALGFSPGRVDQTFDANTERAVKAWYNEAGYQPVEPRPEDRQRITEAEAQVRAARDQLEAARDALAAAGQGAARSELVAAQGDVRYAQKALEQAIADRADAIAAAPPAERARVTRAQDLLVLDARNKLAVAKARLAEVQAMPSRTAERKAVDRAERGLREAQDALADIQATAGSRVPRGEVVFLPTLPRRVEQVKVRAGDEPSGPALVLSGADLEIVAVLTAAQRKLVTVGDRAQIDEQSLGIELAGTVAAIGPVTGEAAAEGGFSVRVRLNDAKYPPELARANVRVTIPVESTDGEVLAVPVAAVSATADGGSLVRVAGPDGRTADVAVRVGLSAGGYVEVEAVDGELAVGDEVVLGLR